MNKSKVNPNIQTESLYFATLQGSKLAGWASVYPVHKLNPNQFALTLEEYKLLQAVWGELEQAKRIIRNIQKKIKEMK